MRTGRRNRIEALSVDCVEFVFILFCVPYMQHFNRTSSYVNEILTSAGAFTERNSTVDSFSDFCNILHNDVLNI
jgi:hypothetical protein